MRSSTIALEGDVERALLEILRRYHPKAIDWNLVSRKYLVQALPDCSSEDADLLAIGMEASGYISFQPFPFLSTRYKPGKMRRCRITPSGEEHLASIEMRAEAIMLVQKKAGQVCEGDSFSQAKARA